MAKTVKYTLPSGVSFSSASKVVSKKWTDGDVEGAYESYLTHKIIDPMAKAGMSKSLRGSWLNSLKAGLKTEQEAMSALEAYRQDVASNIKDNVENQYGSMLYFLRHSMDPVIRQMAKQIEDLIEETAGWYHQGGAKYMAKQLEKIINDAYELDMGDKTIMEMETLMDFYVSAQKQTETAGKFKFQQQE